MNQPTEIHVCIHGHNLPGTHTMAYSSGRLGIQKGNTVVDDVPGNSPSVTFNATLRVTQNPTTGQPNFLGPYAHGTPTQRFLYLSWGQRQGTEWAMTGRVKIQLNHLTWSEVESALQNDQPLQVTVDLTGPKGGPVCGTPPRENVRWHL